MFFTPGNHQDHGLPYNPFKAIVAPRPIGWISSINKDGVPNLAPYSFFNAISEIPPMVGFSAAPGEIGDKDSLVNIRDNGEFVVNIVSKVQIHEMSVTSAPLDHDVSEFDFAHLTPEQSKLVKPPRVKGAPCQLECKLWDILPMPEMPDGRRNQWVMGMVIGIHIDDSVLTDGKVDVLKYNPAARLGYKDYTFVEDVFQLDRPKGGY
jgi:flavin reductase (DIM6/NTAB) family NADH-FMN oxidoreductase RutF